MPNHRITNEEFIRRAKLVHRDKYDYSLTKYTVCTEKVKIKCNRCGKVHEILPSNHLKGNGGCRCYFFDSTEDFIAKARKKYGDFYDYSKTKYKSEKTEVMITCPIHGDFKKKPGLFLQGYACPKCGLERRRTNKLMDQTTFLRRAKKLHGDNFDFSKSIYKDIFTPIAVKCTICGREYKKKPVHILQGYGCKYCAGQVLTTEDIVKRAREIHGDRYDYSQTKYINRRTPIIVICKKHGPFKTNPGDHIGLKTGCPKCKISKGEAAVMLWLDRHNIHYIWQKTIHTPISPNEKKVFVVDFQLDNGIIIEYNGKQHYDIGKHAWGGEEGLLHRKRRDAALREYCRQKGIRLLEIPYTEFNRIEEILEHELNI